MKRRFRVMSKAKSFSDVVRKILAKTFNLQPQKVVVKKGSKPQQWSCVLNTTKPFSQALFRIAIKRLERNNLQYVEGSYQSTFNPHKTQASLHLTLLRVPLQIQPKPKKTRRSRIKAGYQMNHAQILAHSLSHRLMQGQTTQIILERLEADSGEGFKVLRHGDGARDAMETFQKYISGRDYTNFLPFMRDYDNMLYKYRGNQGIDPDAVDDDEDDAPRGRGKKGKRSFAISPTKKAPPVAPPVEDDEPAKDEASVLISSAKEFITGTVKRAMHAKAALKAKEYLKKD